jgi:hypothetical protein
VIVDDVGAADVFDMMVAGDACNVSGFVDKDDVGDRGLWRDFGWSFEVFEVAVVDGVVDGVVDAAVDAAVDADGGNRDEGKSIIGSYFDNTVPGITQTLLFPTIL